MKNQHADEWSRVQKELAEVRAENIRLASLVKTAAAPQEVVPAVVAKKAPTRVCKYCKGPHFTIYCTEVTCSECNEFGHTGYVCPKKNKPSPPTKSKVETVGQGGAWWVKKDAMNTVGFDVTRVDLASAEEKIWTISIHNEEMKVFVGKHDRPGSGPSDKEERPRNKEAKGESGVKARRPAPDVYMLEPPPVVEAKSRPDVAKNQQAEA